MYGRTQALAQAICAAARQSCAASTSGMYSSEALNTLGKVRFVSSAQEYARKRAQHAAELSELRKEWAKEYAQQQALKAAKREAEKYVDGLKSVICFGNVPGKRQHACPEQWTPPFAPCRTAADSRHARQRGTEVKVKQQKAAASQEELSAHKQQRVRKDLGRGYGGEVVCRTVQRPAFLVFLVVVD